MQQHIIQVSARRAAHLTALKYGYAGSYSKFIRTLKKGAVLVNTATELLSFRLTEDDSVEVVSTHLGVPKVDPRLQMKSEIKRRNNFQNGQGVEFVQHVVPSAHDAHERLVILLTEGGELAQAPTFESFCQAIFSATATYYYTTQEGIVEAVHFSHGAGKKINITYAYMCHIPVRGCAVFSWEGEVEHA